MMMPLLLSPVTMVPLLVASMLVGTEEASELGSGGVEGREEEELSVNPPSLASSDLMSFGDESDDNANPRPGGELTRPI